MTGALGSPDLLPSYFMITLSLHLTIILMITHNLSTSLHLCISKSTINRPFLLFQLINGATIGIFNGITSTDAFCKYVQAANMNMVGVIPSLVKAWQASGATDRCDWSCVRYVI